MAAPRNTAKKTTPARRKSEPSWASKIGDAPKDAGKPPAPVGAVWVYVTPEMAQQMLAKNEVNRDVRQTDLESYTREMTNGTWGACVEPIVYDSNGDLINGQHRLMAQVASGTSHWWLLLEQAPPEAKKTVNMGARATMADVLKYNGEQNYVILAGVTGNSYLWQHDLLNSRVKVQPLEGEVWLEKHPDLRHSAHMGASVHSQSIIDIGPVVMGTAHWIISQTNGVYEADAFLLRMAHMHNEPPGSPIIALMKRMNRATTERLGRPKSRDQLAAIIRCWNWHVEGRYVSKLDIRHGSWTNPEPLRKDNPMTEENFVEMPSVESRAAS